MPVIVQIIRPNLPFGCVSSFILKTTDGDDRKHIFGELSDYLKFKMNCEFTDKVTEFMPYKGGKLNKNFPELKFERENSYFYEGELENTIDLLGQNMKVIKKKDMRLIMRQIDKNNWTVLYF